MSLPSLERNGVRLPLEFHDPRRGSVPSSAIPRLLPLAEIMHLYERCRILMEENPSPVIELVCSVPGEGTSTIAAELALVACGLLQRRTLLIDATSGPRTRLAAALEGEIMTSLDRVLAGQAPIVDALASLPDVDLHFATLASDGLYGAGGSPTRTLAELFDRLRFHYELILVDGGSLRSIGFSPTLAGAVDGVLLVVEAEHTRAPVVDHSVETLLAARARLLGAVLNKRRFHIPQVFYDSL